MNSKKVWKVFQFTQILKLFLNNEIEKSGSERSEHDVSVTGIHGYVNAKVNSRMALPVDMCESVEEVKVWETDENLSDFQEKVLPFVKNDAKVLVIVVSDLSHTFDLVMSKIPPDQAILYHESNEREALKWITRESDKKYLITDHITVTGFEFETVLIVADAEFKDEISSLFQRATGKLVICYYSENI